MKDKDKYEWSQGEYLISTNKSLLDVEMIHGFLSKSYWADGVSIDIVKKSIKYSLSFGLYKLGVQIGFARAITDYATFAYLADVFIIDEFRAQGLGKWLVNTLLRHPDLKGLKTWLLATRDAHGLYAQFGFIGLRWPDSFMEMSFPNVYATPSPDVEE